MSKSAILPTGEKPAELDKAVQKITNSIAAQRQRFIEAARALGADEDEAAFREKLGRIARVVPKEEPAPKPRKKVVKTSP